MRPMFGKERALAAGQLVQFVLPALKLLLHLGERLAAGISSRAAAAPPPAAMPVLPPHPPHSDAQRGDFLLSSAAGGNGPLGAAGFAPRLAPVRGRLRQALPPVCAPLA